MPKTVIFVYTSNRTYIACATIDTNLSSFIRTPRGDGTADMYLVDANDFKPNGFNYYADNSSSGSVTFSNIKYIAFE